jgi:hypothetical protein
MHLLASLFGLAIGGISLLFVMLAASIGIAGTVLWIWMLVEVLTRETDEGNNRLIWSLVIIFTHWVGALIYIFVRRRERIAQAGR